MGQLSQDDLKLYISINFMTKVTQNIVATLTTFVALDGYRRTVQSDHAVKIALDAQKDAEQILEAAEKLSHSTTLKEEAVTKLTSQVQGSLTRIQTEATKATEYVEKLVDLGVTDNVTTTPEVVNLRQSIDICLTTVSSEVQKLLSASNEVSKGISTSGTSKNNLLEGYFDNLQAYLDSLTTPQMGAAAHIFFAVTIIFCTINISSAYYGDTLITFLKIEGKLPRLARWIRYRRTFQHYYIAFNIFLILISCFYVIFTNLSIFSYL